MRKYLGTVTIVEHHLVLFEAGSGVDEEGLRDALKYSWEEGSVSQTMQITSENQYDNIYDLDEAVENSYIFNGELFRRFD